MRGGSAAAGTSMDAQGDPPVHLPDPTPWPLVLALGMTLMGAGLVVSPFLRPVPLGAGLSVVGLVLLWVALIQLVREDIATFAREGHE
jgi:hypothetical protein